MQTAVGFYICAVYRAALECVRCATLGLLRVRSLLPRMGAAIGLPRSAFQVASTGALARGRWARSSLSSLAVGVSMQV